MTGAVFVIFTIAGVWLDGGQVPALSDLGITNEGSAALAAVAVFPIIGITVQGAHYFASAVFSGHPWFDERRWLKDYRWFEDPARREVRRAVIETIADCCSDTKITQEYWDFVRNAPADAFFVWLYHGRATSQMIEWARRRRSYSYLGWNWFLAALGGMAAGALIVATKDNELVRRQLLFLIALLWGLAALWSAARMRRDADTMEALWAASQIDPAFRDCIGRKLPRATREGNAAD